jgi:hypothetical protein
MRDLSEMSRRVAVVICSWNKRERLVRCIDSVLEESAHDIFVVDNASTDGSAAAVRERFGKRVTLIENPENRGGSGGFNTGIKAALDGPQEYDFVHLLDNDALIERGAIGALVEFMEGGQEGRGCGIAGSKIYLMARPRVIQEFGAFIDYDLATIRPHKRFYDEEAGGQAPGGATPRVNGCATPCVNGTIEVDYVPACSMLVRAEVFKRVGFLDESFFLYWDDMDFAVRAGRAGYKVYAVSDSRVWHNLGTSNKKNLLPTYYFWRNRIRFFLKYGNANSLDALASDIYTAVFTCRETGKPNTLGALKRAVADGFADVGGPFKSALQSDTVGADIVNAQAVDFSPDAPKSAVFAETDSGRRIEVGHAILDARVEDAQPGVRPPASIGVRHNASMKDDAAPQNVYIDPYGNAVPAARAIMLKARYYYEKDAFVSFLKETGRVR